MANKKLGGDFFRIRDDSVRDADGHILYLHLSVVVRKGISSGPNRFNFRSFAGWIECFMLDDPNEAEDRRHALSWPSEMDGAHTLFDPQDVTLTRIKHIVKNSM